MPSHPHRRIWFCQTEYVAEHPETLQKLKDEVGLTTIMPESPICHTSGFRASEEMARRCPFPDWRQRLDVWPRGAEGVYPPVAGIIGGFDDTPLLRVIEACKRIGIEVWGHIGLWSYGGEVYPEFALRDLDGRQLDRRYEAWGIGLCPSRKEVNEWTRDGLVESVLSYDIDGFDVDHARYPAPANVHSLMACGCESCQGEAQRLGYDFTAMRQGVLDLRRRLGQLTKGDVRSFAAVKPGLMEFLALLDPEGTVADWLRFRAHILAERMGEFRTAVQGAGGDDKVFGSDVFPASTGLLGGHWYEKWEANTDFLTGGSSHGGVVGWATGPTNAAREWTAALCRHAPRLDEGEVLGLMWRLFGLDDLELPETVGEVEKGPLPIAQLYEREVARLNAQSSGRVPLYPPISAGAGADLVRVLGAAVVDHECDGCLFTVNPEDEGQVRTLGGALVGLG
ncbi:MAG: hypothetical protein GKR89_10065 [Candidatus Latescibacteria bacterium]|nr:hypothetical protein [Candidatus Latescibacterota bacterium]